MEFTKQKLIELLIKKASGFYYTESQFEYEKASKLQKSASKSIDNSKITSSLAQKRVMMGDAFEQKNEKIEPENLKNGKMIENTAIRAKSSDLAMDKNEVKLSNFDESSLKTATRAKSFLKADMLSEKKIIKKSLGVNTCDDFLDKKGRKFGKNPVLDNQLSMDFTEFDSVNAVNNIENNEQIHDTVQSEYEVFDDNMVLSNESSSDFNLALVKKKVTTHFVAPDMIAIKILFEIFDKKVEDNDLDKISDEELMELKTKLLEEIKNEDY